MSQNRPVNKGRAIALAHAKMQLILKNGIIAEWVTAPQIPQKVFLAKRFLFLSQYSEFLITCFFYLD